MPDAKGRARRRSSRASQAYSIKEEENEEDLEVCLGMIRMITLSSYLKDHVTVLVSGE